MGSHHEIVSLHLGNYANYVAAHYWNLQDEVLGHAEGTQWGQVTPCVDQSPLFAEALDARGHVTWRPRALFADLSGALGGVRPVRVGQSVLQPSGGTAPDSTVSSWSGAVAVHAAPHVAKSAWVQQLEQLQEEEDVEGDEGDDDAHQAALERAAAALSGRADAGAAAGGVGGGAGVRYWTDYLKVVLPPRCVITLPGAWHGVTDFSGYGDGRAALKGNSEAREELSERVRALVEECDSLQGFQVFADDTGGWGSLSRDLLEEVHQEYCQGGRPCVVFSVRPPIQASDSPYSAVRTGLNEALVLSTVQEWASLYVPLALPPRPPRGPAGLSHLRWAQTSHFATAAVLAAAIDTALLPQRMTGAATPLGSCTGPVNLHSLTNLLTGCQRGCPLVGLAAALPLPALTPPTHEAMAQADQRTQGQGSGAPGSSLASPSAANDVFAGIPEEHMDQLSHVTLMTPGLKSASDDILAQSLCMRGGRTADGPASCSVAQSALDALVRASGHRCVTHRAVCPMPLLVPLPFPRDLWGPEVGPSGQVMLSPGMPAGNGGGAQTAQGSGSGSGGSAQAGQASGGSGSGGSGVKPASGWEVTSAPVLTKLFASSQFEGYVSKVADNWRRCSVTSSGRALLDHWDVDQAGEGLGEALHQLAALYRDDDDEGDGL